MFIGEKLSARVSFFELQLAESLTKFKVKSSGLCVSTGTGSTSWHLSINRITQQTVSDIMKMTGITQTEPNTIEYVTNRFNESLIFKPGKHSKLIIIIITIRIQIKFSLPL